MYVLCAFSNHLGESCVKLECRVLGCVISDRLVVMCRVCFLVFQR